MSVENAKAISDTMQFVPYTVLHGKTLVQQDFEISILGVSLEPRHPEYTPAPGDLALQANLLVTDRSNGNSYKASPMIFIRENLVYGVPAQINDLNMRIRLSQDIFEAFYPRDDQLPYQGYAMRQGEVIEAGEWSVKLSAIDREASHPMYVPQAGDIAVNAVLDVSNADTSYTVRPLFYIRGNAPGNLKSYLPEIGLHIRFVNIHPKTETFDFEIAQQSNAPSIPLEIAREAPRDDIIVLQAIVFPGINLFWIGASLMMLGLFLGMWQKTRQK
jgi:cytochrome c-type biogenesis protein CcmF